MVGGEGLEGRRRSAVVGDGVVGPSHWSSGREAASLVSAGVSGRVGEMEAREVGSVGGCRVAHWLGGAGLMVMSETSRS